MLKLLSKLFGEMNSLNIKYCVWKNTNEVPNALNGDGDIDLYISPCSKLQFVDCLKSYEFISVNSPFAHPYVVHYYGFDSESGKLCHLHCYFRIVTGESHLKQYLLPLEQYLDAYPSFHSGLGPPELHLALQDKLNIFRRKIKLSCLPGILLFIRENKGYREESVKIAEQINTKREEIDSGWMKEIERSNSFLSECLSGLLYRFKFRHLSRFSIISGFAARYQAIAARVYGKIFNKRKSLSNGVIVSIVGLDGSGKSTAVQMLADWLKSDIDVVIMHYGRGRSTLVTFPINALLFLRRHFVKNKTEFSAGSMNPENNSSLHGLVPHLRYLALAYERRSVLRKALRYASRGKIVITDRWYSQDWGKMDSVRLDPKKVKGLKKRIAELEHWYYISSPDPDLLFKFEVDEDIAIQRNRDRNKKDKESDAEISHRFLINSNINYRCDNQVSVDSNQEISAVHTYLKINTWKLLRSQQP